MRSMYGNPHFHFRRMNIDIDPFGIDRKMQYAKREFMLHQIFLIAIFQRLTEQIAFNESAVDIKKLIISVRTVDDRPAEESIDRKIFFLYMDLIYGSCNIFAVNAVNNLLK